MTVRLLALFAAGVAVYLAFAGAAQIKLAGCGEASDCEHVLASRWSLWFGVPVSFLAIPLYLTIFAVSFKLQRKALRLTLVTFSIAAAGTSLWFTYLQFGVMKQVCPYCIAVHACGLFIAGLVLIEALLPRRSVQNHVSARISPLTGRQLLAPLALSLLLVGVLIAGQILGPAPKPPIAVFGGGAPDNRAPRLPLVR